MGRLPQRILLSAVLSVGAAGGLMLGGLLLGRPMIRDAAIATVASSTSHAACEAAPEAWGAHWGGLSLFAYDLHGVSANPQAPPLEAGLLQEALRKGGPVRGPSAGERILSVQPMAAGGPCAVLRMTTPPPDPKVLRLFVGILSLALAAGALLSGAGATAFVVLPFRERVARLSEAARGVGSDHFAVEEPGDDALDLIASVLADSHGRIVQTRTALEQRNRALEEHLAGIAHDLRTPLASLLLALEGIAEDGAGAEQDAARRALGDAVYLSTLVDNLHQGTRLRHDFDVTSGRVDLTELIVRVGQRFAIVGRHAGVAVAWHGPEQPVWVACTPDLAERAVGNLVQNAVQHQQGGGNVALVLQADPATGGFSLVVDDDGPGVPEPLLASLRVEGFRVDAARRRGPGLGMVIAHEIAQRAGWTLTWEGLEPRGTRARIQGHRIPGPLNQT